MFNFNKKRILIIGMPDLVLYCISVLIQHKKNIVGVITSPEDDPTYEYMVNFLAERKLLHIKHNKNFKDKRLLEQIKQLKPDIAFVCSYNFLLPKELYEIPKLGTLNFHPSLLPDYRGANPYFHVLNNNEDETGVTMHFVDETFDTGDIIEQVKVPIYQLDTMGTLFTRLNEATAKLCIETVNKIEKNKELPRFKQTITGSFKTAPKIHANTNDVKINWNKSSEEIGRFIRALNPFFGAVASYKGKEIKIWDIDILENQYVEDVVPGTICNIAKENIIIATKDGCISTKVLGYDDNVLFGDTQPIINELNLQKGDVLE